jgi:hypothetical protein
MTRRGLVLVRSDIACNRAGPLQGKQAPPLQVVSFVAVEERECGKHLER